MNLISQFVGPVKPNGESLLSKVYTLPNGNPFVEFYRNGEIVNSQEFTNVTLDYAEDAAENFALGYGHFDF